MSILFLSFFLPLVPVEAQSWTDITTLPYIIQASGNYRLTGNISYYPDTVEYLNYGILVNASNVVLDGQGFGGQTTYEYSYQYLVAIGYDYYVDGYYAFNWSNVVVKNFNIRTWGGLVNTPFSGVTNNLQVLDCYMVGDTRNAASNAIYVPYANNVYVSGCYLSGGRNAILVDGDKYCTNLTVSDCTFTSFSWGVSCGGSNDAFSVTILNTTFARCYVGVDLSNYDPPETWGNNVIRDCRFLTCDLGLWIENVNVNVTDCTFSRIGNVPAYEDWNGAFVLSYTGNVTIANNVISNNMYGLTFVGGSDNIEGLRTWINVFNNRFVENEHTFYFDVMDEQDFEYRNTIHFFNNYVLDYDIYEVLYWGMPSSLLPSANFLFLNTFPQAGVPIIGDGSYIGGNYWGNPIGTGWSQTHVGNAYGFAPALDFFGDGSIFDYYPLAFVGALPSGSPTPTPTPYIPSTVPQAQIDLYFHGTTTTVNTIAGYVASTAPPRVSANVNETYGASSDVFFGVRVYVASATGSTVELTDGVYTIGSVAVGQTPTNSLIQTDLAVPLTSLEFRQSSLVFRYYVRFDLGAWIPKAVFTTEALDYKKILPANWTFNLYVSRSESGDTIGGFAWGDASYLSGVDGLVFKEAYPTDWQAYYLHQGNFVMFIMAPYTLVLGNFFYGIILLAVAGTLFIRYRTLGMSALFLLIILGCIGGGAGNIIFGEVLVGVVWIILAFGLAVLYWRAFR